MPGASHDARATPPGPAGDPVVVDVRAEVTDLLGAFDDDTLRACYRGEWLSLTLGVLREHERFPPSNRWRTRALVEWDQRTRAVMRADEAFHVLTAPAFAPLMPHAALPLASFDGAVRDAVAAISERLQVDPRGFSLLWIASGSHVTPLHHDGAMVHGRWHLVVRGAKQFDFLPPGSPAAGRLPWWDLHRRFGALYKDPVPDAWQSDGTGAVREMLAPGQMVTWGRGWWHRVEVAPSGVTIGISTRGHDLGTQQRWRGAVYASCNRALGEVEHYLDALDLDPPVRSLVQLEALVQLVVGEDEDPR